MAIPRRYKETSIFKPDAIGDGIDGAAQTATNYISADSTGIRIANANPATATTYQHQTATETEFVVGGTSMAEFGGSGARVGDEAGSHVAIGSDAVTIHGPDANAGFVVSATSGIESIYMAEQLHGNSLKAYAEAPGGTTRDFDQRNFLVGDARQLTSGSLVLVVLDCDQGSGHGTAIYQFSAGTSEGKQLAALNKADYSLTYNGNRYVTLRRTSAAETQDLDMYYRLREVRFYVDSHAPMLSMGSVTSDAAPFTARLGEGLLASGDHQAVFGQFNVEDTSDEYLIIVGNGADDESRSNALTVDWDGNVVAAGAPTFMGVKLIYEPGDTITGTVVSGGYVTNSTRDIRWTVPLSKPMAGSVTLTSMSAMVRMAGTYIWGSSSGRASMPVADVTCTVTPSGINCVYSGSSAISGATNNSECAVDCLFTFAVS